MSRIFHIKLQRVLTDFETDESFDKAAKKVQEAYGIHVPASTTWLKVKEYAKRMKTMFDFSTIIKRSKSLSLVGVPHT